MTYAFEDCDQLEEFVLGLMEGGTGYFRGIEVRCDPRLGARAWTVYGPKITAFVADIGPDDLNYTVERLIRAGMLDTTTGA